MFLTIITLIGYGLLVSFGATLWLCAAAWALHLACGRSKAKAKEKWEQYQEINIESLRLRNNLTMEANDVLAVIAKTLDRLCDEMSKNQG